MFRYTQTNKYGGILFILFKSHHKSSYEKPGIPLRQQSALGNVRYAAKFVELEILVPDKRVAITESLRQLSIEEVNLAIWWRTR